MSDAKAYELHKERVRLNKRKERARESEEKKRLRQQKNAEAQRKRRALLAAEKKAVDEFQKTYPTLADMKEGESSHETPKKPKRIRKPKKKEDSDGSEEMEGDPENLKDAELSEGAEEGLAVNGELKVGENEGQNPKKPRKPRQKKKSEEGKEGELKEGGESAQNPKKPRKPRQKKVNFVPQTLGQIENSGIDHLQNERQKEEQEMVNELEEVDSLDIHTGGDHNPMPAKMEEEEDDDDDDDDEDEDDEDENEDEDEGVVEEEDGEDHGIHQLGMRELDEENVDKMTSHEHDPFDLREVDENDLQLDSKTDDHLS